MGSQTQRKDVPCTTIRGDDEVIGFYQGARFFQVRQVAVGENNYSRHKKHPPAEDVCMNMENPSAGINQIR